MAITVVSSTNAAATPGQALPGMSSSDGTTGGFADLLFSQLGNALSTLTAAGATAQTTSTESSEKAGSKKEIPDDPTALSSDPALAFLIAAVNAQAPAPAPTTSSAPFEPTAPAAPTAISAASNSQASATAPTLDQILAAKTSEQPVGKNTLPPTKATPNVPATGQPFEAERPAALQTITPQLAASPTQNATTTTDPATSVLAGTGIGTASMLVNTTQPGKSTKEMPEQPNPQSKFVAPDKTPSSVLENAAKNTSENTADTLPQNIFAATGNTSPASKDSDNLKLPANIAGETQAASGNQENSPLITANAAQHVKAEVILTPDKTEVSTPLQSSAWSNEFANKVVWLAKNDQQQAQININPAQLGPIQISLQVNGDQVSATFGSANAEVRHAIENSLPQLKEMFASAGINLGQADVGSNMAQQNREAPYQSTNGNRLPIENAILPGDSNAGNGKISPPLQQGRGLVDLFA